MKVVVLVKQVPVVTAMRFDPETRRLAREGVPSEVSAFDVRALVRAVEMRETLGGEVVAMTMGPPGARAALVHCLALGADRGIHLVDPAFAGADTLATARALAAALRREGFDLVLCGRHSVDAETGQVGPEVAELLGIVQVTGVHRLDIDSSAGRLTAERETDDGYETVRAALPALVTAAEDLAPERFPTKTAREEAKTKPVMQLGAGDLGVDVTSLGAAGSPTEVAGLEIAETSREGLLLEAASVAEAVERLAGEIGDRGLLSGGAARDLLPAAPDRLRGPTGPAYWVFAEILGTAVRQVTFELLGKAGELARERGGHVVGFLAGGPGIAEHAESLAAHGADVVYVADDTRLDPYTTDAHAAVLAAAIRSRQPAAVLVPSTALGRDLAPRVAARLGLGLTGDCIDLAVAGDGRLVQYKPAFGGNVTAPILSRTRPDMATVRPGMLPPRLPNRKRRVEWERVAVGDLGEVRLEVVERSVGEAAGAALLDTAPIVVGVGKGVGGPGSLAVVRELAAALAAPLAATRDVTDLGWLPRQCQVGLTGRAIAPALYVAVALRGAPEHVVGIRRAGFVVAINNNPKAPIFRHADRGIVADYAEAVPLLVAALRRRSGPGEGR
jgi:electron transfer flavoprotein alpha subunit